MSIENITASLWQELSARTPPPNTTTRFCSSSGFIYQIHLKKILYVSVECNGMKPLTTERPLRPMVHRISCVVYKKGVMLFSAGTDVICVCKPEGRFISCFLFSPGVTIKCLCITTNHKPIAHSVQQTPLSTTWTTPFITHVLTKHQISSSKHEQLLFRSTVYSQCAENLSAKHVFS